MEEKVVGAHLEEPTMSAIKPGPLTSNRAAGMPSCTRSVFTELLKAATVYKLQHK